MFQDDCKSTLGQMDPQSSLESSNSAKSPELWPQNSRRIPEDGWMFDEIDQINTESAEKLVPKQLISVEKGIEMELACNDNGSLLSSEDVPRPEQEFDIPNPCSFEHGCDLDESQADDDLSCDDDTTIINDGKSAPASEAAQAVADVVAAQQRPAGAWHTPGEGGPRAVVPGSRVLVKWDPIWAPDTDGWSAGVVCDISSGRTRNPNGPGLVTRGWAVVEYAAGDRHIHLLDPAHHADAWGDREMAWRNAPGPPAPLHGASGAGHGAGAADDAPSPVGAKRRRRSGPARASTGRKATRRPQGPGPGPLAAADAAAADDPAQVERRGPAAPPAHSSRAIPACRPRTWPRTAA